MSWVIDDSGDGINLDHIVEVGIRSLEQSEPDEDHVVVAVTSTDSEHILLYGTEEACKAYRDLLLSKMHIVKGVK